MVSEPKTFKVPRVNPKDIIEVEIYRGGIDNRNKYQTEYKLKKQTINGITIPAKTLVLAPGGPNTSLDFSSNVKAMIPGWRINQLLRTIVIDSLRKKK
jgi:hypothetical protein